MLVQGPVLIFGPRVAEVLDNLIEKPWRDARKAGQLLDPQVQAAFEDITRAARESRERRARERERCAVDAGSGMPPIGQFETLGIRWLRVADVALRLGRRPRAVRGLCERGTLPAVKDDRGHWIVDELEVDEYIEQRDKEKHADSEDEDGSDAAEDGEVHD